MAQINGVYIYEITIFASAVKSSEVSNVFPMLCHVKMIQVNIYFGTKKDASMISKD